MRMGAQGGTIVVVEDIPSIDLGDFAVYVEVVTVPPVTADALKSTRCGRDFFL